MRLDALILAAGSSSRLGQPKQALRRGDDTLLTWAARAACAAVDGTVHVVVGADDQRPAVDGVRCHEFARWSDGQHASLCFGLAQLGAVDGALVLPCDQYRVSAAHLATLVAAFRRAPQQPVAASYAGVLGIPVVWPAGWFAKLAAAVRPQALLRTGRCTPIALPEAAYDLDTPEDIAVFKRWLQRAGGVDPG